MIKTLADLQLALRRFADERDWERFHSPKNLAMALGIEVAELSEHFQWLTQQESFSLSPEEKYEVQNELADILIYLVRLADRLEIDLLPAAEKKLAFNAEKYPADAARGYFRPPDTTSRQDP
jgi:NTP pyrophosphatase (non-canonical NTP hydrolase)